jgi:hypothetical protein
VVETVVARDVLTPVEVDAGLTVDPGVVATIVVDLTVGVEGGAVEETLKWLCLFG